MNINEAKTNYKIMSIGLMTPDCVSKDATAPDALPYCKVFFIASIVIRSLLVCVCVLWCLLVICVIWGKCLWGHWRVCGTDDR